MQRLAHHQLLPFVAAPQKQKLRALPSAMPCQEQLRYALESDSTGIPAGTVSMRVAERTGTGKATGCCLAMPTRVGLGSWYRSLIR